MPELTKEQAMAILAGGPVPEGASLGASPSSGGGLNSLTKEQAMAILDGGEAPPAPLTIAEMEAKMPVYLRKGSYDPVKAKAAAEESRKDRESRERVGKRTNFDKFRDTMGTSFMDLYLGGKGLVTDLSTTDKVYQDMARRDERHSGGWGTAGRVTGEIAQMALPGAAVAKAAKLAPKGAAALAAIGELGVAGGHGYVKAPGEGATRAQEAVQSMIGAGGGMAAAKALGTAVKGIAKTPAADALLKKGAYLTPGQATESGLVRGAEFMMNVIPFTAKGTEKLRGRAIQSWQKIAMKDAAAPGETVTDVGDEGMQQLKKGFNDAYGKAWSTAGLPSTEGLKNTISGLRREHDLLNSDGQRVAARIYKDLAGIVHKPSGQKLKQLDNTLRKRIQSADQAKDFDLKDMLSEVKANLRKSVNPESQELLKATDAQYGKFLSVQRAAKNAAEEGGEYGPRNLMQAIKAKGRESEVAQGKFGGAFQGDVADAITVLQKKDPSMLGTEARALSKFAMSPTPVLKGLGNTLIGQTRPQKALTQVYDPLVEALAKHGITPRTVGAAYEE